MLLVTGEMPPRRYYGYLKDLGQNYVRGIAEGNGEPPDGGMWLTYSMNKEDIWVSRVPVPVRSRVETPLDESFDQMESGGFVTDWNIYSPSWARVAVVDFPSTENKSLMLSDSDPCDYARAERVFPQSKEVTVTFRLQAAQSEGGELHIELVDGKGTGAVRIKLDEEGCIQARQQRPHHEVGAYEADRWYKFTIRADTERSRFDLSVDGTTLVEDGQFVERVDSLERVVFCTGRRRWWPTTDTEIVELSDMDYGEQPERERRYYLNELRTSDHKTV